MQDRRVGVQSEKVVCCVALCVVLCVVPPSYTFTRNTLAATDNFKGVLRCNILQFFSSKHEEELYPSPTMTIQIHFILYGHDKFVTVIN